jgi:hypothetical protein
MARIWDEKFEGTGYEETWSGGETIGTGCTLNEDYATSGLASPPAYWDAQCLQVISDTAGDETHVQHDLGAGAAGTQYYRLEIMIHSATVANYQLLTILRVLNTAYGSCFNLGLNNNGGTYRWGIDVYGDTTPTYYSTFAFDTYYRIEIKWDNTNNAFEWKIDGTSINTLAFTNDSTARRISLGARNHVAELYIDNFAIDDADWVGSDAVTATSVTIASPMEQGLFIQKSPVVSAVQSLFTQRKHVKMIF